MTSFERSEGPRDSTIKQAPIPPIPSTSVAFVPAFKLSTSSLTNSADAASHSTPTASEIELELADIKKLKNRSNPFVDFSPLRKMLSIMSETERSKQICMLGIQSEYELERENNKARNKAILDGLNIPGLSFGKVEKAKTKTTKKGGVSHDKDMLDLEDNPLPTRVQPSRHAVPRPAPRPVPHPFLSPSLLSLTTATELPRISLPGSPLHLPPSVSLPNAGVDDQLPLDSRPSSPLPLPPIASLPPINHPADDTGGASAALELVDPPPSLPAGPKIIHVSSPPTALSPPTATSPELIVALPHPASAAPEKGLIHPESSTPPRTTGLPVDDIGLKYGGGDDGEILGEGANIGIPIKSKGRKRKAEVDSSLEVNGKR